MTEIPDEDEEGAVTFEEMRNELIKRTHGRTMLENGRLPKIKVEQSSSRKERCTSIESGDTMKQQNEKDNQKARPGQPGETNGERERVRDV